MNDPDAAVTIFTTPPASDTDTGVTTASETDAGLTTFTPSQGSPPLDAVTTSFPTPLAGDQARLVAAASGTESGPLTIGQRFGRYTIVRLLGIGGMGAVYQAWDEVLEVVVALKVIRPEAMRDPGAEQEIERRFKRELLLARQVTHKNVVRIHDLGELDGIKYITMSYVSGTDLATVVKQEGRLPVPKALQIVRSVVSGLVAAHAAGVVHRDLKPANIMIDTHGEALIMDFGIARSTGGSPEASGPASAGLPSDVLKAMSRHAEATMAGKIVGTVEYMAPEQARGEPADQRADVYATGLILYDLLVGKRRAEHAGSAVAELRARMEHPLPPLESLVPEVPKALAAIVARAVESDETKRYQATTEFAAELDRLDENGEPLPLVRRLTPRLMAAIAVLVAAALAGTFVLTRRAVAPKEQHEPVSVVIADFVNGTGDAAFNRTLEPMLKRALDDAGFITAYDRNGLRGLGVPPRDALDEVAAREVAVQQGLGVVLSGSIDPQRNGYRISIRATQSVTNTEIANAQSRASTKDGVLGALTGLAGQVRKAMGDDTSTSAQQFAGNRISTTSMEVVGLYAASVEASAKNKFEEARQHALKAVELDPNFGLGYMIAAVVSGNLGRLDDHRKYLDEALRHLDGMTERERYLTRGYSYLSANDYQQCVKEYNEAVVRYKADVAGRNNLALCLSKLRRLREAMQMMQQVVKILPKQPLFRDNLALYANYAGDFQTAEQEARAVEGPDFYATLAIALAQLGQGQLSEARETYKGLGKIGTRGASFAASGLGDMATLDGRFSDAVEILRRGVSDDVASANLEAASAKLAAIAYAEHSRGRTRAAIEAADEALRRSTAVTTRFLAARTFVEAGDAARARPLIDGLAREPYAEPQAYAKIVQGVLALKEGDARRAVTVLREANELFDTWIGLFDLGRASLEAGLFAQADSAFDTCLNARRGEALSLFLDEEPTYAYLAPVHYYLGRAREGLKSARYAESYREYLKLRGNSKEDPLLIEVRQRAGR